MVCVSERLVFNFKVDSEKIGIKKEISKNNKSTIKFRFTIFRPS
jgi:hypothetical protein